MRLWSLHPRYLDRKGLVALWREGLLAQKVLGGHTRGYRSHPQLDRFRDHPTPATAIASYLDGVIDEASSRGYRFDRGKIQTAAAPLTAIEVTEGQLSYELEHLAAKLQRRDPAGLDLLVGVRIPEPHPSFTVVPGPVASWERVADRSSGKPKIRALADQASARPSEQD
ncbi:MAG: pyrimidine dimer DNA glycosylase/endonuclease V [bacterium]|nr:pyrimidine dimer DNA glycosylase/endonuclease V [bacterium]